MKKVMIVDDDYQLRGLLGSLIGQLTGGVTIIFADCLKTAKDFAMEMSEKPGELEKIDLVLLDFYVGEENGINFLEFLRSLKNGDLIQVIMMSGNPIALREELCRAVVEKKLKMDQWPVCILEKSLPSEMPNLILGILEKEDPDDQMQSHAGNGK